jgi:hypothetical protein
LATTIEECWPAGPAAPAARQQPLRSRKPPPPPTHIPSPPGPAGEGLRQRGPARQLLPDCAPQGLLCRPLLVSARCRPHSAALLCATIDGACTWGAGGLGGCCCRCWRSGGGAAAPPAWPGLAWHMQGERAGAGRWRLSGEHFAGGWVGGWGGWVGGCGVGGGGGTLLLQRASSASALWQSASPAGGLAPRRHLPAPQHASTPLRLTTGQGPAASAAGP